MIYTIKPGQWNFRPLEPIRPRFGAKGFYGSVVFHESAWFDWGDDKDEKDWNKLKGLTAYFGPNNRHSVIIGWRPTDEKNVFELTPYTNYPRSAATYEREGIKVRAGEEVFFECDINAFSADYVIKTDSGAILRATHNFWKRWIYREIGTSIGGANNSPGEFGGKATQEMKIEIDFFLK